MLDWYFRPKNMTEETIAMLQLPFYDLNKHIWEHNPTT